MTKKCIKKYKRFSSQIFYKHFYNLFCKFFFFNFILSCFFSVTANAKPFVIKELVGQPSFVTLADQKKIIVKKNQTLDESYQIKTRDKDTIKLELGDEFFIVVFSNSSLKIEAYYDENKNFNIKKIHFDYGRFYLKNDSALEADQKIRYTSEYFDWNAEQKVQKNYQELFFEIPSSLEFVNFCSGQGGATLSLFAHETVQKLKNKEAIQFVGELHQGRLTFDELTANNKIPKGEWKNSSTCDFQQILKLLTDLEAQVKAEKNLALKKEKERLKKIKDEYDRSLCHEPNGQFNECHWFFKESSCYRSRCDGQGHWVDVQKLPAKQNFMCTPKKSIVKKCDY